MKYCLMILLSVFFVSCDFPGDPIQKSEQRKGNLYNGGNGTNLEPYVLRSGTFQLQKDFDRTYFTFKIRNGNDDCSLLLYDISSNEGTFSLENKETLNTYSINKETNLYSSFKNMSNGTYSISLNSNIDSEFGLYSKCVDTLNGYKLKELKDKETYKIENEYELFTFILDKKSSIKLDFLENDSSYSSYSRTYFNWNFEEIYDIDELEKGTYYLLLQGSKKDSPEFKFILK